MSTPSSACRFCAAPLSRVVADLGMQPLSNAFLRREQLNAMEPHYPLTALVCDECMLVQLEAYESPDAIFSDYVYFSSYSSSWLDHCRAYVGQVTDALQLGPASRVVEIASNDGYLLQYFVERGIPAHGVEPAANVAEVARSRGIPTTVEFFGAKVAERLRAEQGPADLLLGNNVLAHVPDLNDFVAGLHELLAPQGTITMEFPHLLQLLTLRQYDTIYHEHFSYFSLLTVRKVFAAHGLRIHDVEELATHGGSLRIWAVHDDSSTPTGEAVEALEQRERAAGLADPAHYDTFAAEVRRAKRDVLDFFIDAKNAGSTVVAYGAAAKGNTLLNYCGLGTDFIDFVVDLNPHKQGLYLPGTHIPVLDPDALRAARPDWVFVLPWNLRREIEEQLSDVHSWGGRFVAWSPELAIS
ncbi:MAG: SAM-dependent methyltransferase [Frankiales bacterium]|nr:SAM-dependent methyltransferase [Frankiales bacterium]